MNKQTRQRDAIRQTFLTQNRPLTAQELHEAALELQPSLGLATVYRCLKLLAETGEITAVELPNEPTRYEMSADSQHAHFLCRNCGHAFCLEGDLPGPGRLVPEGFEPEDQELVIFGRCSECRQKPDEADSLEPPETEQA
jgi:Fur family ferric uptake transcriptional regulator